MAKERKYKKRKSDSDGVKVKRSYYSFSKYYPGGGSSQKYRKVMVETKDEKRSIKIALTVLGLLMLVVIGYFVSSVALNVSNAPTTEPKTALTETEPTASPLKTDETSAVTKPKETEPKTTIEEPEREVNVTGEGN